MQPITYPVPHLPMLGKGSVLLDVFDTNGNPVSFAISAAAASAKPGAALIPVPTAVPPSASRYTPFSASAIRSILSCSIPA